jgi:hypothetical protein
LTRLFNTGSVINLYRFAALSLANKRDGPLENKTRLEFLKNERAPAVLISCPFTA